MAFFLPVFDYSSCTVWPVVTRTRKYALFQCGTQDSNILYCCDISIQYQNVIFYRYDMALAIFRKYDMHSRHIAIWQYIVDVLSLERKGKGRERGEGGEGGGAACYLPEQFREIFTLTLIYFREQGIETKDPRSGKLYRN
jgi:hypothetical protein